MGADDDRRIDPRLTAAGGSIRPMREHIQALLDRRAEHDKLTRAPPAIPFADVLAAQPPVETGARAPTATTTSAAGNRTQGTAPTSAARPRQPIADHAAHLVAKGTPLLPRRLGRIKIRG